MSCTRALGTGLPRASVTRPRTTTACAGMASRPDANVERRTRVASRVRVSLPCARWRRFRRFMRILRFPFGSVAEQRLRTGLLTGAISRPIALAAPSRCDGISGGCRNGLTQGGACFTVAGQWRSFTALPEHSRAVAVVGKASTAEERCRKGRDLSLQRHGANSGDDEHLAGGLARLQIDLGLLRFGERVSVADPHLELPCCNPGEDIVRAALEFGAGLHVVFERGARDVERAHGRKTDEVKRRDGTAGAAVERHEAPRAQALERVLEGGLAD